MHLAAILALHGACAFGCSLSLGCGHGPDCGCGHGLGGMVMVVVMAWMARAPPAWHSFLDSSGPRCARAWAWALLGHRLYWHSSLYFSGLGCAKALALLGHRLSWHSFLDFSWHRGSAGFAGAQALLA